MYKRNHYVPRIVKITEILRILWNGMEWFELMVAAIPWKCIFAYTSDK